MSVDEYCDGAVRYLSCDDLISLNQACIKLTPGEPAGVLRPDQLASSQVRPAQVRYYEQTNDMARLAAALMCSLIQNHPFHNANKRTAFMAAVVFMRINGHALRIPLDEGLAMATLIVTHERNEGQVAQWLAENSTPFDSRSLGLRLRSLFRITPALEDHSG